jgi:hypothetical protein
VVDRHMSLGIVVAGYKAPIHWVLLFSLYWDVVGYQCALRMGMVPVYVCPGLDS